MLITGGAGFVGANLANRLLADGERVVLFDNLSRPGVERNLRWLADRHGARVQLLRHSVLDSAALQRAVAGASAGFHFAAQVAVTSSLDDPRSDFETNALGTFNVLEAVRRADPALPVIFTSTNKVYGGLEQLALRRDGGRYEPRDAGVRARGIDESTPLSFVSPYGCSKGAADQYVLDYARSYGMAAVVFRMSCIYGPRQMGTEDQGWVAHFCRRLLAREPVVIYGDGCQVRDLLYVDDLVDAFKRARAAAHELAGEAYNIGGGPTNSASVREVLAILGECIGSSRPCETGPWRRGDQRYYVSDTTKFMAATGWQPVTPLREGLERLRRWLGDQRLSEAPVSLAA